ncbi:MAG: hypothetical protein JW768_11890 [Chitinispirillaceae bacterium]|nr:hypothetical protein [Chitinispirillaceae bacterium]
MRFHITWALLCLIGLLNPATLPARTMEDSSCSRFQFLTGYHVDAELRYFAFYKSIYYKEHYFLENTADIEFGLLSYEDKVVWIWTFMIKNGMGQTPGLIVFDPIDIGYGITPLLEYRGGTLHFQFGIDHFCFHQIDRQELPTVYYNNPYLGVGSKNMRLYDYWAGLLDNREWTFFDRWSWYVRAGYYVRELFGLVHSGKLNGVNPYVADLTAEFRYCFWQWSGWIVNARTVSLLGYHTDVSDNPAGEGIALKQELNLEASCRRGAKGSMLFMTFALDRLPLYPSKYSDDRVPRFSYDRLLQLGLKFFF